MASNQLFSGRWALTVQSTSADFSERFVIEGSDASDGTYPGATSTPPLFVSGPRWFLRFEWNNNVGSGWQPSDIMRTDASFTLTDGLVTVLGADDNFEPLRDHDFNDLVLRCHNLDPKLNPGVPVTIPPGMALPPRRPVCPPHGPFPPRPPYGPFPPPPRPPAPYPVKK
jgi:hypothetical protein